MVIDYTTNNINNNKNKKIIFGCEFVLNCKIGTIINYRC